MKIKTSNEEVLMGKFVETLLLIKGDIEETRGYSNYSVEAVRTRFEKIQTTLLKEIKKLSNDIVPDNNDISEVS